MFAKRWYEPIRERFFEKGDLKYVILDLLKEKPSHGYEIIRALEERFHGFYAPSPGAVYPTLQMLEDMGYVAAAERDGKKVYTITDQGRKFLEERRSVMDEVRGRMNDWWDPGFRHEVRGMMHELRDLGWLFARRSRGRMDPDRLRRVRDVVSRARHDIEAILESQPHV